MDKKQKTIFSCLGCGCGTLIFIAILFVIIAVASGGGIMNTIYRYTNPEKMTYGGRRVTTLANEQYEIIDETGKRWGFAAPDRTAEHLNINDHGVILRLTHYRDRKKK